MAIATGQCLGQRGGYSQIGDARTKELALAHNHDGAVRMCAAWCARGACMGRPAMRAWCCLIMSRSSAGRILACNRASSMRTRLAGTARMHAPGGLPQRSFKSLGGSPSCRASPAWGQWAWVPGDPSAALSV